jgi:hypothetical protein
LRSQVIEKNNSIDIVEWSENRRLTYNDFRAAQDSTFLVYGYPANGSASTKIKAEFTYGSDNRLIVTVTNVFYKSKSWMVVQKPSVLNHEQGHFDISEIFARRLRKEFRTLIDNGVEDEMIFQQQFNKCLADLKEFQKTYDTETHHGFSEKEQILWDNKIKNELNKQRSQKL